MFNWRKTTYWEEGTRNTHPKEIIKTKKAPKHLEFVVQMKKNQQKFGQLNYCSEY